MEIDVDLNKNDAAMDAVDAVIALMNSSKEGKINLKNVTKSSKPKETFIQSFDDKMKALNLVQPLDFSLPQRGFSLLMQEILVYPSKRILHFYSQIKEMNKKWGCAYTSYTGCVAEIRTTDVLLRIFGNTTIYSSPPLPKRETVVAGDKIELDEGTAVEFKEFGKSKVKALQEILKYVSAFANTTGGFIIFGVKDDRTIQGIEYTQFGPHENSSTVRDEFQKQIKTLTMIKLKDGKLNQYRIEPFKLCDFQEYNVLDRSGKNTNKSVLVVGVPRVKGGVVFTKAPKCPYFDKVSKKPMPASVQTWCDLASECLPLNMQVQGQNMQPYHPYDYVH